MLKKTLITAIFIAGTFINIPATAAFGRIISQNDAAEAAKVEVISNSSGYIDRIRVKDCTKCPLELFSNRNTRFSYKGKKIKEQDAKLHSGKTGTVIFDPKSAQVIKVNW